MKGRGIEATLAAIATLTAAWPVSTLLDQPTWLGGTVLLLAVIAVSGVASRSLALRGWQVFIVQLVCATLTASAIYGRGHLWHGLPTFETLRYGNQLVSQALATVQQYAAPAPTTPGLALVVGCALALVALAVDYLAVTRQSPSLAGLPLLTAFLATAANSGSSLPVFFFLLAAAMWLVMVARQGTAMLDRWGTTVAMPRTPVQVSRDSDHSYGYAAIARTLAVAALAAAVVLPVVLPQLPPKFLISGLGRSSLAGGNGSGTVGFSLSLDLAADLNSRSTAPVLEYRTADTQPPPLRVAVSSSYESQPGVWNPQRSQLPTLTKNPDIPPISGLLSGMPKKGFVMAVTSNLLDEPNLAVPYPLISADLNGVAWGLDNQTQDVKVSQRPDSYSAAYWQLAPTPAMLQEASAGGTEQEGGDGDNLKLDDRSARTIIGLSERLTSAKSSSYDKAIAIQEYLRSSGGFTYSLTLAAAKNSAGNDANFDPLTNFLVTKQGYCVQFATAMVMMSRAAGIPARMAIGFLPGTLSKGSWTVTASDAHTWPELYLSGIGWTRFEPTPTRAAPPSYALPPSASPGGGGGRPVDPEATAATRTAAPKNLDDPNAGNLPVTGLSLSPASVLRWITHGWGLVLLASLLGLLGSLVVPTAARWRRRRDLVAARTSAQRVEVEWNVLTSSLGDLGIVPAPSRTPRQVRAYYAREVFLEGEALEALGRVVQTLESTRYAASATVPHGLAADTRQVVRAAAATRRRRDRLRAALWPSSGLAQLRSARAHLIWSVRAPLRDASDVVRQRFSRRR